jgi:hypothetical protein
MNFRAAFTMRFSASTSVSGIVIRSASLLKTMTGRLAGRSGIPLSRFAARWDQPETRPSTVEPGSSLDRSAPLTVVPHFHDESFASFVAAVANLVAFSAPIQSAKNDTSSAWPKHFPKGYGPLNYGQLKKFIERTTLATRRICFASSSTASTSYCTMPTRFLRG